MKNYYKVLGVKESATDEELKEAKRMLLKRFHPDTFTGDKDFALKKTSDVNEAFAEIMLFKDKHKSHFHKSQASETVVKDIKKSVILHNEEKRKIKKEPEQKIKQDKTKNSIFRKKVERKFYKAKNENSVIDLPKGECEGIDMYANKTAVNSVSNLAELYETDAERKHKNNGKFFLDVSIIFFLILTVGIIILLNVI